MLQDNGLLIEVEYGMKLNMKKYRILTSMKYVLLFIFLTLHSGLFGQERFFYLDLCENFLSENDYTIKRISKDNPQKRFTYLISDYYKNGQLFTTGIAKSKNGRIKDGEFIYYYSNGTRMASGSLVKDARVGKWQYWDSTGREIDKANLIDSFQKISFSIEGNFFEGKCLCYVREADWIEKMKSSEKPELKLYEDGNRIAENGIYYFPEDTASYKGGYKKLYEFLQEDLTYPFITRLKGMHGKVFVRFIITSQGEIEDPQFLVTLDKATEKRILKSLFSTKGNWIPGKYNGKNVSTRLILPIVFQFR